MATTWWQELENRFSVATIWHKFRKKSLTAQLVQLQERRKRTTLPVNRNSAVKTRLRQLKQTKLCWPFSSWQITTIPKTSLTTLLEFPSCQSHSRQRFPNSTGNLKSSSCLKISSKWAAKSVTSWLKKTESTTSILSWGEMHYKQLKTVMPKPRESGRNPGSFSKEICKTPIDGDSETQIPETCLQPSKSKLVDFLDELQRLAKDAFGIAAHAINEQFVYAKMPPHLKKSINQAHSENGTNKQIVTDLETELELIGLESPDELQVLWATYYKHKCWQTQTNLPPL